MNSTPMIQKALSNTHLPLQDCLDVSKDILLEEPWQDLDLLSHLRNSIQMIIPDLETGECITRVVNEAIGMANLILTLESSIDFTDVIHSLPIYSPEYVWLRNAIFQDCIRLNKQLNLFTDSIPDIITHRAQAYLTHHA